MSSHNYAPDPNFEKVYTNLQNKTLGNVTAEDIQKLTDPTFIQATNQDALITYNLINQAAMRNGLPMPDSGILKNITVTENSTLTIFKPLVGEVFQLIGASATTTGGAARFKLGLLSGETVELGAQFIEISDVSPSSTSQQFDFTGNTGPLYLDNKVYLACNFSSMTAGETASCRVAVIRVR